MCLNVEKNIYKVYTNKGILFHCCNRNTRLLCRQIALNWKGFFIVTVVREHCYTVYDQWRAN